MSAMSDPHIQKKRGDYSSESVSADFTDLEAQLHGLGAALKLPILQRTAMTAGRRWV